MTLFATVSAYIDQRVEEFDRIQGSRKQSLDEIARYVTEQVEGGRKSRLTFVCTHNSRRSQISQCWARTAATRYGFAGVETFSGGTEITAFNPRAVEALKRAGFAIDTEPAGENPVYLVHDGSDAPEMRAFSKIHDQAPNPTEEFCAVMTCSSADANCPVVPGASMRISIFYDDPGEADGTTDEDEAYDRCCRRISREMLYLFASVRA